MRILPAVILTASLIIFFSSHAHSTAARIYAEGGYTATQLVFHVFIDILPDQQDGPLRTAGVKLLFPSALGLPFSVGNRADWYIGEVENPLDCFEPDISVPGEVTILSGKMDTDSPMDGVSGNRILLGKIIFERPPETEPPLPVDFTLTQGRAEPFVNSITIHGTVLDDTISYLTPSIRPLIELQLRAIIRMLQILSGQETDVPVRPAEYDMNDNRQIELQDIIAQLADIAD